MKNEIFLSGEVGWEITLKSVMDAVKETDPNEPLTVNIHSFGGCVFEGLAIYTYLKQLDREVNTFSTGTVASIATIIFLAGTNRTLSALCQFLVHCPWTWVEGSADEIEDQMMQLRKFENQLADIYELETNLTKEEALVLMKEDKFSDIDFVKEKGFATEIIQFKAVAKLKLKTKNNKPNNNKKTKKMAKDNLTKDNLTKDEAKTMFAGLVESIKNMIKPKNKIVTDATGKEIDFPDVDADNDPVVGDSAEVDGNAIGDIEVLMPNEETWVFVGGKLDEIKPKEDESTDDADAKIADLEAKLETANEQVTNLKSDLQAEKDSNIVNIKKLEKDIKAISDAVGSDFNYEPIITAPVNGKKEGTRSFKGGVKK